MENVDAKERVYRYLEAAFVSRDFDRAMEFLASDYVLHDSSRPGIARGPMSWREAHAAFLRNFRDSLFTLLRQIADGALVATHWKIESTTGPRVSVCGISITRLEDGKIAEEWISWDSQGLEEQLRFGRNLSRLAG